MRTHLLMATAVAAALLAATSARAQFTNWTGAVSSDWFTAGNWNAGVPTGATNATIDTVTPNATVVGTAGATAQNVTVGNSGTGALTIANGGTVNTAFGGVGQNAGSQGTVTVTGAGSTWNTTGALAIGGSGMGALTIANGGTVNNFGNGFVGANLGGRVVR